MEYSIPHIRDMKTKIINDLCDRREDFVVGDALGKIIHLCPKAVNDQVGLIFTITSTSGMNTFIKKHL